ncbi:MAG TPA: VCBS repeat-containing protein, partial [Gemmataceae bacterium]|nr:VCBS repeat-containing protein [Gemmataceae bacterium]
MSNSTIFAALFDRSIAAVLRKHWILSIVTLLGLQATSINAGFVTAPTYQPGGTAVAVADLNGDGIPDLAEINNDGGVSILFGNGDGTFQPAQNYDTGGVALSVAVGDLNGDGLPDLAVVNINDSGGTVGILLGAGNGTFKAAQNYTAAANPVSVAVGDFNGDGVPDLAVANAGTDPDFLGTVSIFLGNGDGSFKTPQNYLTGGPNAQSVAVADFNGDGHLDLAVTDFQFSGALIIFLGNGDGSFRLPQSYTAGQQPATVATGDFNRDGHPDVAVVTEGKVLIYLGNGDGTFQSPQSYLGGASALAAGDFNGDGVLDLAVGGVGTVSILVGNGDGTFQAGAIYAAQSLGIAAGDFNVDGHTDIASLDSSGVSVLLNKGDGTFGAARSFMVGSDGGLGSVAVADFNGDGKLDLATGNGKLLLGNGDGTFQAGPNLPASGIAIVAGDLNGDNIPDLVMAMVSFNPASPSNTIAVMLGNGDGTFQAAQHYTVGQSPSAIALGDFNGDGIPDLAVADGSGVSILLGNGNGTFQATRSTPAQTGSLYVSLAVGDFNQDGKLDVVTSAGSV